MRLVQHKIVSTQRSVWMWQEFWCCWRGWCLPVSRYWCHVTASKRGRVKHFSTNKSGSE